MTSPDPFCIIMEHMDLGSLYDMLHKKKVKLMSQMKLDVMKQVILALVYLHQRGIIHGDIKSHNVLMNRSWQVKICDFGISKLSEVGGKQSTVRCTPNYAAPEVFNDIVTWQSDIFSFGILLWETFAEEEPHPGVSTLKLATNIHTMRPDIKVIEKKFSQVALLVQQCWPSDIESRPTAQVVHKKIQAIQLGEFTISNLRQISSIRFSDFVASENQWNDICLILDNAERSNWRMLGDALKFTALELDNIHRVAKESPSRVMLNMWKHGKNATMGTLISALEKIDQWSVIHKIMEWSQPSNAN